MDICFFFFLNHLGPKVILCWKDLLTSSSQPNHFWFYSHFVSTFHAPNFSLPGSFSALYPWKVSSSFIPFCKGTILHYLQEKCLYYQQERSRGGIPQLRGTMRFENFAFRLFPAYCKTSLSLLWWLGRRLAYFAWMRSSWGWEMASSHSWISSEWGKCLAIRANRGEVGLSVGKGKTVLNRSLEAQSATGF